MTLLTPEEEARLVHVTLKLRAFRMAYYDNPVTNQREQWKDGTCETYVKNGKEHAPQWRKYPNPWQATTTSAAGIQPIFDDLDVGVD